ncbi:MAG: DUF3488 and transglutaminase-like domain-containing protein, partial [Actinomycetota bacterium]
ISQDIIGTEVAVLVLILAPLGFVLSYLRRHRRNIVLKVVLSAFAIMILGRFLASLGGVTSVEGARAPLAEIFLLVQALHSFDLPRRRDLHFSLASSVTLIALAGSLSLGSSFIVFFLPWGIAALASLAMSYQSEIGVKPRLPSLRMTSIALLLVIVAGLSALLFAPRIGGSRFTAVAFKIPNLVPIPPGSGILNPGLSRGSRPGESPDEPGPNAYFGFGNFVDLRVRGRLSDEVVLKVRAPRPAFWRGAVFDVYERSAWGFSSDDTRRVIGLPALIAPDQGDSPRDSVDLLQTFYVQQDQPNLVFAAYNPREVWFPTGQVEVDDQVSVRSRVFLNKGTVYSVLSSVPVLTEQDLRATSAGLPPALLARYTQIPSELPRRVRDLAQQIAGGEPTTLGKARAIEKWLVDNTQYEIDIPRQPRGTDAVDHFLFEEREGYCEQIATSMAVMLRTLGVPARFATGYASGERDLLSGFFEVKQSDAHSWVEIHFPQAGWVEFDPTHEVPAAESRRSAIPGLELLGKLIPDGLGNLIAGPIRQALSSIAASGTRLAMLLLVLAALLTGAGWLRKYVARPRQKSMRHLRPAVRAFAALERAADIVGFGRPSSLTPHEYGLRLKREVPGLVAGDVEMVVKTLELDLYSGTEVDPWEAEQAAARLVEQLRTKTG